jgi:hypothetical protein
MVYVKSIVEKDNIPMAVTDSFPEKNKQIHAIIVHLDQHPEWDFTVQLKKKIQEPSSVSAGSEENTFVVSDIEGEFEPFRNLLLAGKVIDEHYNWTFGKGNLIIAGDLFDRGKQVSQFLWLLYKLEDEAAAKGGAVHVILGNHDIMNLSGDFRYVQPEYVNDAGLMHETYANLYAKDTELGRWLRSKNVIEKIGDLLVLHAGISKDLLGKNMGPAAINATSRPFYDVDYQKLPDSLNVFFDDRSPFWYRGYFVHPKASIGLVDSTLAYYRVKKIVVGHDIIEHVAAFYEGNVIGVDVDEHEDTHEALLIENNKYYRLDDKGNKTEFLLK